MHILVPGLGGGVSGSGKWQSNLNVYILPPLTSPPSPQQHNKNTPEMRPPHPPFLN